MSDLHSAWYCLAIAWRQDRRLSLSLLLGLPLLLGITAALGLWQQVIVDQALAGSERGALVGGVLLSLSICLSSLAASQSTRNRFQLEQKVAIVLESRAAAAVLAPGISDHLLEPEAAAMVESLRGSQLRLGTSLTAVITLLTGLTPLLATAGLLLSVHPILLLLAVAAGLEVAAARRNASFALEAEIQSAPDAHLRREYLEAFVDEKAREEIWVNGGTPGLAAHLQGAVGRLHSAKSRVVSRGLRDLLMAKLGFALALGWALLWLTGRVQAGQATVGEMVLAVSAARRASVDLSLVTSSYAAFAQAMGNITRLRRLESVAQAAGTDGPELPSEFTGDPAAAGLRHVSYSYPGASSEQLRDVTIPLVPGTSVAVVGSNGAGKTTLVRVLCRALPLRSGTWTRLLSDKASGNTQYAAAVHQPFLKLELDVASALAPGGGHDEAALLQALVDVGLSELASGDGGFGTSLNPWRGGRQLSEGQWQRLALARARLQMPCELLILDEPSSALDPLAEAEVVEAMQMMVDLAKHRGSVAVLVCHRLSLASRCNYVVVMHEGAVVEAGTPKELVARGGLYAEQFALQASGYA